MAEQQVEPWLRGTHKDIDPVRRAVLHALELANEDLQRWCAPLDTEELEAQPFGLPSAGFQLRHIARSLDRLMTYAEGHALTETQLASLREEHESSGDALAEAKLAVGSTLQRLLVFSRDHLHEERSVGRAMLPTTVAGLLIHVAEHTQRHVGQAITTAKVVLVLRASEGS